MKVGIHLQPTPRGPVFGGASFTAAVLAEALTDEHHAVELVHHRDRLEIPALARFAGATLDRVTARAVPLEPEPAAATRNPVARMRAARARQAGLSAPYDLFVTLTHEPPPFCAAPRGCLVVLFPWRDLSQDWPWRRDRRAPWRGALARAAAGWEWRRRFAGYQVRLANSAYTRHWTRRRWRIDCDVVYPPTDVQAPLPGPRRDRILSVGRFSTTGASKRQLEMVEVFRGLERAGVLPGWEYVSAGGVAEAPEDRAYFERVTRAAAGSRASVLANVDREPLRALYATSKLFWHAAGLGDDESLRPERSEHFGVVTVEAMAAGCVPVVIRRGGQGEIVEHGVSGFLWETPAELADYTRALAADDALRRRMSEAACLRARAFSRDVFRTRMLAALARLLGGREPGA